MIGFKWLLLLFVIQVYTYAPWAVGPAESVSLDESPAEVASSASATVIGTCGYSSFIPYLINTIRLYTLSRYVGLCYEAGQWIPSEGTLSWRNENILGHKRERAKLDPTPLPILFGSFLYVSIHQYTPCNKTFSKKYGGHQFFSLVHWCPCFGLLVTSVLGFKVNVDLCLLHRLCAVD